MGNGKQDEVDDEGYTIPQNRGFSSYGVPDAFDSSDDEKEEEQNKLRVTLREEAKALPTSYRGLSIAAPPGSVGLNSKKGKKNKKKGKIKAPKTDQPLANGDAAFGNAFADFGTDVSLNNVSQPSKGMVEASIIETINARIVNNRVDTLTVRGEINFVPDFVSSEESSMDFRVLGSDKIHKLGLNKKIMTLDPESGIYSAKILPGSESLCLMKYSMETEPSQFLKLVPIMADVDWKFEDEQMDLTIEYAVNKRYFGKKALMGVKFLIACDEVATKVIRATPAAQWNSKTHKLMWQFKQLPAKGVGPNDSQEKFYGKLSCTLECTAKAGPQPVHISFSSEIDNSISGLGLQGVAETAMPVDVAQGKPLCTLGKTYFSMKNGSVFTAE